MLFLSHLKRAKMSLIVTGCATAVKEAQGLLLHCGQGQCCATQQDCFRQWPAFKIETNNTPPAAVIRIQGE